MLKYYDWTRYEGMMTFDEARTRLEIMDEDALNKVIAESPYHNATANDIDWVSKVKMQGMVQKHIDHSISVTVNIPKEATEETVEAIYREAYLAGCKGVTVYRDGSRSGVLVTEESDEKKIEDSHAPRRPKTLKADVIQFQNNHEKWVAFIGLYHGRPYEIFAGKLHDELVEFTKTKKDVKIIKEKSDEGSKYFAVFNGTKIEVSSVFNQEYWNYAKLISGLLRHGMPLQYVYDIIKGMNWNDDHLNSWKNGVARIIKRYISDGVKSKAECPDCGGKLEFQEGCESCSCGHSKCG
jgi:ribonucleoside-diphosphate reductase alpha chain